MSQDAIKPRAYLKVGCPFSFKFLLFASEARLLDSIEIVRCLDVVAPRKFATVRHAGELHERRGLVDELHLNRLPLVPLVLGREGGNGHNAGLPASRPRAE